MKITKRHFDRAVKQKWSTKTCLIAQAAAERGDLNATGEIMPTGKGSGGMYIEPYSSELGHELMRIFDRNFTIPGTEQEKIELQLLRAMLPLEI
jgi:hypothetical protein